MESLKKKKKNPTCCHVIHVMFTAEGLIMLYCVMELSWTFSASLLRSGKSDLLLGACAQQECVGLFIDLIYSWTCEKSSL